MTLGLEGNAQEIIIADTSTASPRESCIMIFKRPLNMLEKGSPACCSRSDTNIDSDGEDKPSSVERSRGTPCVRYWKKRGCGGKSTWRWFCRQRPNAKPKAKKVDFFSSKRASCLERGAGIRPFSGAK